MKVEKTKNLEQEQEVMTATERRLLIEYLEKKGWSDKEIVDLLKYISL